MTLRSETYETNFGKAYKIFINNVEIGVVAMVPSKGKKREWENVCWATQLRHAGFKNKLEAINDLYHWHTGLVAQHDDSICLVISIH